MEYPTITPIKFPEANTTFNPPPDMTAEQVLPIPAYRGQYEGGSVDGSACVVVAYKMNSEAIQLLLRNGGIFYFSMMGGLAPHYPSLTFHDATHPA